MLSHVCSFFCHSGFQLRLSVRLMPGSNLGQMNQNLGVEWGHMCFVKAPPPFIMMCKEGYHFSLPSAILFPVLLYSFLNGEKHCILNNEIV